MWTPFKSMQTVYTNSAGPPSAIDGFKSLCLLGLGDKGFFASWFSVVFVVSCYVATCSLL
jgi:hypothetical protein